MTSSVSLDDAVSAFQQGDIAQAWALVQRLLEYRPVDIGALELFGVLLFQIGRTADALDPFQSVAAAAPLSAVNQFRLALAAEAAGQLPKAGRAIVRALLVSPAESQAYLQFSGQQWRRDARDEALLSVVRTVVLKPGDLTAVSARAQMRFQIGDMSGAQRDLMREAVLAPERGGSNLLLAESFRRSSWPRMVERLYRRHCRFAAPMDPGSWLSLSLWLIERRQTGSAVSALRHAICLDPANANAWEKLAASQSGDRAGETAGIAVRAAAFCAPDDGMRWLRVVRHFAGDLSPKSRAGRAISLATRCAAHALDVRFALAEFYFQVGDVAEAEKHMLSFMQDTHDALMGGSLGTGSHRAVALFLNFMIFRRRPAECLPYLARVSQDAVGDAIAAMDLLKIQLLAELDMAYGQQPHRWDGSNRRIISLPVWGEKYVDMWLTWGLPSILVDSNAVFWEHGETVFHILTTPGDWERLSRSETFAKLRERASVVFFDLTPVVRENLTFGSYVAMSLAHWASICIARREQADFVGLVADYVFSSGSFGYLAAETAANGIAAAFTVDLPIHDRALPVLDGFRSSEGGLEVPADSMIGIFLEHPSHRVPAYEIGPELASIPSDPSRLNLRLEKGWRLASMQPQLFYLSSVLLAELWYPGLPATDNGTADMVMSVLGAPEPMRMLNLPEHFCCAVIESGDESRAEKGYFSERCDSASPVRDLVAQIRRSRFMTPARIWALEHPTILTNAAQTAVVSPAQEAFVDSLRAALPQAEPVEVVRLAREIGFPAFERYMNRRDGGSAASESSGEARDG
jgi:tetratricopeptide (TPR) repeat protein